jgi:hypothetical protein
MASSAPTMGFRWCGIHYTSIVGSAPTSIDICVLNNSLLPPSTAFFWKKLLHPHSHSTPLSSLLLFHHPPLFLSMGIACALWGDCGKHSAKCNFRVNWCNFFVWRNCDYLNDSLQNCLFLWNWDSIFFQTQTFPENFVKYEFCDKKNGVYFSHVSLFSARGLVIWWGSVYVTLFWLFYWEFLYLKTSFFVLSF